MKRRSHLKNRSRFIKRYKRVFFLFLVVLLVIIIGLALGINYLQTRIDNILGKESYMPSLIKSIDGDLEIEFTFNDMPGDSILSNSVINLINNSKYSIDVAMFAFTNKEIITAIENAFDRGVEVRLILDKSNYARHHIILEDFYNRKQVKDLGIGSTGGFRERYMHNKFMVVDVGTESEVLVGGTFNWTPFQELYDPSYIFETRDTQWLQAFGNEFNRLWSDTSGTDKLVNSNYNPWASQIEYNNGSVEFWWGPGFKENSFKQRMLDAIVSAENDLQIAIWHLTDRAIATSIIAQAARGVQVSIITDDYNIWLDDSEFAYIMKQINELGLDNVEVLTDVWRSYDLADNYKDTGRVFFNPYLHRHTLIVDNKLLFIGTANWSYRGFFENDESGIIISNNEVIDKFKKSWQYHYDDLRNQRLEIMKMSNGFQITNFYDNFLNKDLIALQGMSGEKKSPIVCASIKNISIDTVVVLDDKCIDRPINIFVYDNEKVLGNGWYYE